MINFNNVNWYDQVMMESGLLGNVTMHHNTEWYNNVSCAKVSRYSAEVSRQKYWKL